MLFDKNIENYIDKNKSKKKKNSFITLTGELMIWFLHWSNQKSEASRVVDIVFLCWELKR